MRTARNPDLGEALEALGAEELRSLIQEALDGLDDGPRGHLEDTLLRRAASTGGGWRPAAPPRKVIDEVRSFVAAALRAAQADPTEFDDYLRQGVTASLAADHASARAIFEALLPPIANADIYLGQDEMVDEVLSVDVNDCVARYLAVVYLTTPPEERAEAFFEAIEKTSGLAYLLDPLKAMTEKLGVAWLRAPSLLRLLRWLLAGKPSAATLRKRARTALEVSPTKSPRLLWLLHVVLGDVPAAAALLEKAPGLGWSSGDHPGHLLFPAFAWMLGGAPAGSVHERVAQVLRSTARELGDFEDAGAEDPGSAKAATSRLSRPSVMDALERAEVTKKLTAADRASALAAMKAAATKRTDGVLENKRRRHYAHAALLVACCVKGAGALGGAA